MAIDKITLQVSGLMFSEINKYLFLEPNQVKLCYNVLTLVVIDKIKLNICSFQMRKTLKTKEVKTRRWPIVADTREVAVDCILGVEDTINQFRISFPLVIITLLVVEDIDGQDIQTEEGVTCSHLLIQCI